MPSTHRTTAALIALSGLVLTSCDDASRRAKREALATWVEQGQMPDRLDRYAQALDVVADHLDTWGTLSISAPAVALKADDFKFDLGLTDKELYDGNKNLEAKTSQASSFAMLMGAALKLSSPVPGMMGTPAVVDPNAPITPAAATAPADAADREKKQTTATLRDNAAIAKAEAAQGLVLTTDALLRDPRALLRSAASDRFELGMHKFLSKLGDGGLPPGSKLVFMPFTVTCQPGWKSKIGFTGVIDASAEFEVDGETMKDSRGNTVGPQVVAVYPAIDSQEMDLRMSRDQFVAMSFALEVIGNTKGARAFVDLADKYREQSESLTSLTRMVGYSNGGQRFGFEFMPDFRALQDPAKKRSHAGYQLEATSFPAVAIVLVQRQLFDDPVSTAVSKALPMYIQAVEDAIQSRGTKKVYTESMSNPTPVQKQVAEQASQFTTWAVDANVGLEESGNSSVVAAKLKAIAPALSRTASEEKLRSLLDEALKSLIEKKETRDKLIDRLVSDILAIQASATVQIRFHYSHLWRPYGNVRSWSGGAYGVHDNGRMSMQEWVESAKHLEIAMEQLKAIKGLVPNPPGGDNSPWISVLKEKWYSLNGRFENHDPVINLGNPFADTPKAPSPLQIADVFPRETMLPGGLNTFFIQGKGFDKDKPPTLRLTDDQVTWVIDPKDVSILSASVMKVIVRSSLPTDPATPAPQPVRGKALRFQMLVKGDLQATSSTINFDPTSTDVTMTAEQDKMGITKLKLPINVLNGTMLRGQNQGAITVDELVKIIDALRDAEVPCCDDEKKKQPPPGADVRMRLELEAKQALPTPESP